MRYKGKKISKKRKQELLEARSNKEMGLKRIISQKLVLCAMELESVI